MFLARSMRLPLLAALALAFCLAACDAHEHTPDADHALHADRVLFVMNQGEATVSLLDPGTGAVLGAVDLQAAGFSANAAPHMAVVEPDGSAWYLSLIGENAVVKFDHAHRVVGRVTTAAPGMLALSEDGRTLYASRSLSAVNPPASVAVIDRKTMTLAEERPAGYPHPHGLTAAPGRAFTASLRANVLVTLREDGTTAFTNVDGPPQGLAHLARSPDGERLAVSADLTGQVHLFRVAGGVPVFEGAVSAGSRPWHPHFSRDGRTLYVPLYGEDRVAVVDVATRTVRKKIEGTGLAQPYTALLSADGKTLFVTNANLNGRYAGSKPGAGTVVLIDTATDTIRRVVEVGRYPTGLGLAGAHH